MEILTCGRRFVLLAFREFRVKHWGARTRRDTYRGYNGYVLERNNRRGGRPISSCVAM